MGGELKALGQTDTVLDQGAVAWEIEYAGPELEMSDVIKGGSVQIDHKGEKHIIRFDVETLAPTLFEMIRRSGGRLISFNPKRIALENIYTNEAKVSDHA
jgi:hypothetical protein